MEFRVLGKADLRLATLSALPMVGAVAGAALDERMNLGFTAWRSACRAVGVNIASLVSFTWQLLPWALTGLLLGAAGLLVYGAVQRRCCAQQCLAAHAGCVLSLPLGLWLCASSLPLAITMLAEIAAAILVAMMLPSIASRSAIRHP